jgi:chlorophyll synthase
MDSTDMANHRRREVDWIAYLTLLKPITWFPPMWAMACGLISAGLTPQMAPGQFLLGIILAGPLLCGASQIINDWCDRHVDAINQPERPIPSGRAPGRSAYWFAWIWSLFALAFSFSLGVWVTVATLIGLFLSWAYSAPPLRLKRNGWWGNSAVAISYEGLAWITGAAIALGGNLPSANIMIIALLYSVGAHGIMTLNDFKSVQGDRMMQLASLPARLGEARAARVACWFMALPQVLVIALLIDWQLTQFAGWIAAGLAAQLLAMRRLLSDPKKLAPWYNAVGVTLYVAGMMVAANAISALPQALA